MDLHQMFNTAVADLPDLPDQVPAAERIHRRRATMTMAGSVAAGTALVVGVGTLTITSPWSNHARSTTVSVAAGTSTSPSPTATSNIEMYKPLFGSQASTAPTLSGDTLTGAPLSTSYAGHVTVIVAWGSWCTPCRDEAPAWSQTYLKYRAAGVQFIGLDERDDNAAALSFQQEFDIDYPSLKDPNQALVQKLKPDAPAVATTVPTLILIDSKGKVRTVITGYATTKDLDQQISSGLAGTW
jgi:thiol-disulfide isomerase/thioredoxin